MRAGAEFFTKPGDPAQRRYVGTMPPPPLPRALSSLADVEELESDCSAGGDLSLPGAMELGALDESRRRCSALGRGGGSRSGGSNGRAEHPRANASRRDLRSVR